MSTYTHKSHKESTRGHTPAEFFKLARGFFCSPTHESPAGLLPASQPPATRSCSHPSGPTQRAQARRGQPFGEQAALNSALVLARPRRRRRSGRMFHVSVRRLE